MDEIAKFTSDGMSLAMRENRLFITLTYAQSLDGSIAAVRGQPTLLSGKESMTMTHKLRTLHDGIMIGIGTLLADNPSLNARFVDGLNPQPIIVDGDLRCPLECKLLTLPTCRKPYLLSVDADWNEDKLARRDALVAAGATILNCIPEKRDGESTRRIDMNDAFDKIFESGIRSVMVEGGASIITSCLASQATSSRQLLTHGILTIAPIFIGGLKSVPTLLSVECFPRLVNVQTIKLGQDIVLFGPFGSLHT